jgi:phosphomannomutase
LKSDIHFGTDGWRAKIAEGFTFEKVGKVSQALAAVLPARSSVLVGFDTRFASDRFAKQVGQILIANKHKAILADSIIPTPALSLMVGLRQAQAGVMITASHNSGEYNGYKIKLPPGVSAPSSFTQLIEKHILKAPVVLNPDQVCPTFSWKSEYLNILKKKVDLASIKNAGLKIVVDSMHGAGQRLLEELLSGGKTQVRTIAGQPDPLFGGRHPEPIAENLKPLCTEVKLWKAAVGFANDGDADRIGMVDECGHYVDVHKIHALIFYHLKNHRKENGSIIKTVSGTMMIEKMAQAWNCPVVETPVGFKYIGEQMMKNDVLLGMEESGGIAIKNHLPERDGLLSALLLTEALSIFRKPVTVILSQLQKQFGPYFSCRHDMAQIPSELQLKIIEHLKGNPPLRIAGTRILGTNTLDGLKFQMDNAWLLIRSSGTEPLLRIYAEASSLKQVQKILAETHRMILSLLRPQNRR